MKIDGRPFRTIWVNPNDPRIIQIIDQRFLPHKLVIEDLRTVDEMARAIKEMHLRGAPLVGVAAAFGIYLAAIHAPEGDTFDSYVMEAAGKLISTRPTAVNLKWGVEKQLTALGVSSDLSFPRKRESRDLDPRLRGGDSKGAKIQIALETAKRLADEDVEMCKSIGRHGLKLLAEIQKKKNGRRVNILTHCNAGWLACIDWGTATSAIYQAFDQGMDVRVWVDETRPRNQGAGLTAWEFGKHGVPHTVIVDNAAGHIMQKGEVDIVIVGTDRTTAAGDVANKIGTYTKALAARDNGIPFYAAVPSSSIDWNIQNGKDIPIEERDQDEVRYVQGLSDGTVKKVLVVPEHSKAANYAFDVTPRRLVTGLITERGIAQASEEGLLNLFPENRETI
ncbi:MAG: S-methyl-5-thioribose-1-phosphate isomerase [Candidatus Omnitrophica bacterium]|nr:S-methyl-5-thioribose-1-phosphate isomerase [Candidatus Omnitrophota bacterium]